MRKQSRKQAEAEDISQLAARLARRLIETKEQPFKEEERKALAAVAGRFGELKGGPATAKLSKAQRRGSASKAARGRWGMAKDRHL
jgi:hypothetical protein